MGLTKPIAVKRASKNKRDLISSRSIIAFEITDYAGNPNFTRI